MAPLLAFACAVAVFAIFMLARNVWVFRTRMGVLDEPGKTIDQRLERYERLPYYNAMMLKFWVWDVRKFERLP